MTSVPGVAGFTNIDGETPLHLACGAASEEVQEYLIDCFPRAAGRVDRDGETPLHLAVVSGASLSLLCKLVKTNPYVVMQPNFSNRTPFDNLKRSYKNANSLQDIEASPLEMLDDYRKALMFLRVSAWCRGVFLCCDYSGEGSDIPEVLGPPNAPLFLVPVPQNYRCHPLHAASWINCPRELVKTLAKFSSDHCLVRDSFGNTPLCLAASASIYEDKEELGFNDEAYDQSLLLNRNEGDEVQQPLSVMNSILSANPHAASIPNSFGRYPLSLALEYGKTFEEVAPLIKAYPQALETKDSTTNLYPFMIAATAPSPNLLSQINTVYELLRMQPDLVNC
jgi:ankyrin repeat protein